MIIDFETKDEINDQHTLQEAIESAASPVNNTIKVAWWVLLQIGVEEPRLE